MKTVAMKELARKLQQETQEAKKMTEMEKVFEEVNITENQLEDEDSKTSVSEVSDESKVVHSEVDDTVEESESTAGEAMKSGGIGIQGVKRVDENTVAVATDVSSGNTLHIRALVSKSTNRRSYLVFETNIAGEELGVTSCDALFKASEVLAGSSKIKHLIQDLTGNYEGQIADIISRMVMIEKKRLLVPTPTLDIDSCKTVEEFYARLKHWFVEHIDDVRVGVVDIKGSTHIALVKRAKAGLNDVFQSVCKEIAPNLKPSYIKGELYRRGLLNHDKNTMCNDTQLTVSYVTRMELGILNDKIISFVFDEETMRMMKDAYEVISLDYEEEE